MVLLLYTPWKHQKTFRFSDVFRGYRKAKPGCKGLNKSINLESLKKLLLLLESSWNNAHSCWGLAEGVLQVYLITVLCFKWSVKKKNVKPRFYKELKRHFYMKITLIPSKLVINLFYPFFTFWRKQIRIRFSSSWWSGNKKYLCFVYSKPCSMSKVC